MSDDRTTARARRRQAAADGTAPDAVDRRSPRSNPRGRGGETTSRQRQLGAQREVAEDIGIDDGGVGGVDRIRGGLDLFLRSPGERQWGQQLRGEFAEQADFVEDDDVDPRIDGQAISAAPQVARDRRATVADRARRGIAGDTRFLRDEDLEAEVGAFGVESISVPDHRRSAVADRTRTELAGEDPFAEPDDFTVDVTERGVESAGLTARGQLSRAARQFEASLDIFGSGDLDPDSDIREVDGGFGLGEDAAREVAAADLDAQIEDVTVTPGDIELEEGDDGTFEAVWGGR